MQANLTNQIGGYLESRGTIEIAGAFENAGSVFIIGDVSSGLFAVAGGFANSGTIDMWAGTSQGIQANASLLVSNGVLVNTGRIRALGSVTNTQARIIEAQINNRGTLEAESHRLILRKDGAAHRNLGMLSVGQNVSVEGTAAAFLHSGEIDISAGATLDLNNAPLQQTAGTTVVEGTLDATAGVQLQGGTLTGTGSVAGDVTNSGGTVRPGGDLAGRLSIAGSYAQTGGTLDIQLGGTEQDTQYDRLNVSGTASLGGELDVAAIDGFTPDAPQTFEILTAGSVAGSFATSNASVLDLGIRQDATAVTLTAGGAGADPEATRQIYNAGLGDLADSFAQWGELFDVTGFDLPVLQESLSSLFGIGGPGGLLEQVGNDRLETPDTPVVSFAELAGQIDALPGFTVLCVAGDEVGSRNAASSRVFRAAGGDAEFGPPVE